MFRRREGYLLASPSRTHPSSCSSCLGFSCTRRLLTPRCAACGSTHQWVRSPFFGFYVILLESVYAQVLPVRGRTDVLSRPRLPVASRIALISPRFCPVVPRSRFAPGRPDVFPGRDCVHLRVHCCIALSDRYLLIILCEHAVDRHCFWGWWALAHWLVRSCSHSTCVSHCVSSHGGFHFRRNGEERSQTPAEF